MNVILPDGNTLNLEEGATLADAAQAIGAGLAKAALAGTVDGKLVDLTTPLSDGQTITIITKKSPEALDLLRHSAAHVMAKALQDLYGHVDFGIGPSIENGFYYDIRMDHTLTPEDLEKIEERMNEIVHDGEPFTRQVVTKEQAKEMFADQPLKLELIDELPDDEEISIYRLGDFVDLCRGPHLPSAAVLPTFKLTKLAGAYWRGDSDREMLQRVYGTAFFSKKELNQYLENIAEAEKRDSS